MKKKKKLVPSIQHAPYKFNFILSLLLGEKRLWEGMKVLMGKSGGKSVARLDSHVLLSCIFPPNSVIFASPFQNGPLFEEAKNNETRKYTPNTQVLNGPFQLVLFVSPFNFRPCDVLPQKTVFFKFRPIHVYMHVQFQKRQKANSLENITQPKLGKQNMQAKKAHQLML